jgi:hypothetical protein
MLYTLTTQERTRRVEVGQILLPGTALDPRFPEWIRATVAAKHFTQFFSFKENGYVLHRCVVGSSERSDEIEVLPVFAEIELREGAAGVPHADLEAITSVMREWVSKAIATLVENASSTGDEVEIPRKIDLVFESAGDIAFQITN